MRSMSELAIQMQSECAEDHCGWLLGSRCFCSLSHVLKTVNQVPMAILLA